MAGHEGLAAILRTAVSTGAALISLQGKHNKTQLGGVYWLWREKGHERGNMAPNPAGTEPV